jgi:urea transport system substrate-binding protein
VVSLAAVLGWFLFRPSPKAPIRIGVLHSLTGTMADSEQPLVDAVRLAVEEINAQGGLLGRPVELVVADGRSDDRTFAAEAERLIVVERVSALFGCWTSSSRKAVKAVVERRRHLLFYPAQYEGFEQSPNIIYLGAVPNQQIIPGTRWAMERFGSRAYLLGSDYLYPRLASLLIRDLIQVDQGTVVGERFLPLGAGDFSEVIAELRTQRPDFLVNNLNGDSNRAFFRALRQAGLGTLPVISFSLDENGLAMIGAEDFHPNHYAVWGHFHRLAEDSNRRFVAALGPRFGRRSSVSDPVASAYVGVKLWAQAVAHGDGDDPREVGQRVLEQTMPGPSGPVALDQETRHAWRRVLVLQARSDGQFDLVEDFSALQRPRPFPDYRPRNEWRRILAGSAGGKP